MDVFDGNRPEALVRILENSGVCQDRISRMAGMSALDLRRLSHHDTHAEMRRKLVQLA